MLFDSGEGWYLNIQQQKLRSSFAENDIFSFEKELASISDKKAISIAYVNNW